MALEAPSCQVQIRQHTARQKWHDRQGMESDKMQAIHQMQTSMHTSSTGKSNQSKQSGRIAAQAKRAGGAWQILSGNSHALIS
jgi:hypothetical protein